MRILPGGRPRRKRAIRAWAHGRWNELGPGLITGASDNDPSGITTYSVAGAATGYGLLWLAVATMPLLVAVQSMAARIGAVKEEGLGQVIEDRFGRPVLIGSIGVLLVANTATIAADLGGVAAGVHLLVPIPIGMVIPVVGLALLGIEVFGATATSPRSSSGSPWSCSSTSSPASPPGPTGARCSLARSSPTSPCPRSS